MLVERTREVALEQLVVVDCLGNNAAHKFEVAQMVGIAMRSRIDHVRDTIPGRRGEECVHGVEDFPRNNHIPEKWTR